MLGVKNNKIAISIVVAILLLIIDRFFKSLALAGVFSNPIFLLENIFSLNFTKNYYIAFSLPIAGGMILTGLISVIILGLIGYLLFLCKKRAPALKIFFLLLIILGAASNLTDRIKLGFVVDYWDLKYFTVFNLADTMITIGVIGLILFYFNKKSLPK